MRRLVTQRPLVAALVVALAGLAGCAAPRTPPYVGPSGADTARLLARGFVGEREFYAVYVFENAAACADMRLAGVGNRDRTVRATTLPADRVATVSFAVSHLDTRQVCAVRWSFWPVAGRTYVVVGRGTEKGCSARVVDATDPDNLKPEPTAQRRNPEGQMCAALRERGSGAAGSSSDEAVLVPGASDEGLKGLIEP